MDFLPCSVTDRPCPELTCDKTSLSESQPSSSKDNSEISNTLPQVDEIENIPPNQPSKAFKSPEEIRGYPKAEARKLTGKERRSMITTDTPEKRELEEKFNKNRCKKQKKNAVKRKIQESDDEEEENEWHSNASSDIFVPELNPT